mmetsp:Transcript_1545/g.2754  ORF Transcript_1545/g.2754 Transcript_1545/m.2754 type:complete len:450 (-) Transcript_1545:86-1435(-)
MSEDAEASFLDLLDELDEIAPLKEPPRVERPPEKPAPVRQRYVPPESSEEENDEEEEEVEEDEKVDDAEWKNASPGTVHPVSDVPDEDDDPYKFLAAHPAQMFQPPRRVEQNRAPAPSKTDAPSSAASSRAQRTGGFSNKARAAAADSVQDTPALPSYSDLLDQLESDEEEVAETVEKGPVRQTNLDSSGYRSATADVPEAFESRESAPASEVPRAPKGGRRCTAGAPPTATSSNTFNLKAELKSVPAWTQPDWKKEEDFEKSDQSLEAILARLDKDEQEENAQQVWDSFREMGQVEGREIQSKDAANLPGLLGPSMKALTGPLVKVQQQQSRAEKDEFDFQAPDDEYLSKIEERRIRLMEADKAKRAARDAKLMQRMQKAMDRERSGGVRSVIPPAQRNQRIGLAPLKPMGIGTPARPQTGTEVLDDIFNNLPQVPRIKPAASSRKGM